MEFNIPYNDNIIIGNVGRFEPQEDITPLESVRINQLFLLVTINDYFSGDHISTFVEKYGLERHFNEVSDGKEANEKSKN